MVKKILNYKLIKKYSFGTYSKVYLAVDCNTNTKVCIKIFNCARDDKIKKEIEILKSLDHVNIIKYLKFFKIGNKYYLVTELGEKLKYNFVDLDVKKIMLEICQGIKYCHDNNIIHGDVKLENIILKDNKYKLIDFGYSRVGEFKNEIVGSYFYIAPEIFFEKKGDKKVDIWSLGIMLYILNQGNYLYYSTKKNKDDIILDLCCQIQQKKTPFPFDMEIELQDLLKNMLNTDPKKRFDINQVLNHPWFNESLF